MQKVLLTEAANVQLKQRNCPETDKQYLEDALFIVKWAIEFGTPLAEGSRYFSFSPGDLNKTSQFKNMRRTELDGLLSDLMLMGILSEPAKQESTGGRPKTLVTLIDANFVESNERTADDVERTMVARYLGRFRSRQPYVINDELIWQRLVTESSSSVQTLNGSACDFLTEQLPTGGSSSDEVTPQKHMAAPVKVLFDFNATFNGRFYAFKKGHCVSDPFLVALLVEQKMPVIGITETITVQYCPRCNTPKPLTGNKNLLNENGIYLRPVVDFMVSWNGTLIRAYADQVLTDTVVNRWMLTQPECCPVVPVKENIDFLVCANGGCQRVFLIDPLVAQGLT